MLSVPFLDRVLSVLPIDLLGAFREAHVVRLGVRHHHHLSKRVISLPLEGPRARGGDDAPSAEGIRAEGYRSRTRTGGASRALGVGVGQRGGWNVQEEDDVPLLVVHPQHGRAAGAKVAFGRGDRFVGGVAVEHGTVDAGRGMRPCRSRSMQRERT